MFNNGQENMRDSLSECIVTLLEISRRRSSSWRKARTLFEVGSEQHLKDDFWRNALLHLLHWYIILRPDGLIVRLETHVLNEFLGDDGAFVDVTGFRDRFIECG